MASPAPTIRPASSCCRASTFRFSTAFRSSARCLAARIRLTWLAWALVPAVAFALAPHALGPAAARDGRRRGDGALGRPRAARHPRRLDRLRRRAVGPRGRASLDRRCRPVQRGHHRRARLHRAGRVLFRPQTSIVRTALGALLFGVFDAAQIRLQGRGVPAEIVQTLALCHRHPCPDRPRLRRPASDARERPPMTQPASKTNAPPTALLLVDVINSFFVEGMPNHYPAAAEVIEPLRRLLAKARASGQHRRARGRAALSRLRRLRVAQTAAPSFHRRRPTRPSSTASSPQGPREIVCPKRRYSAFFATDLALFLREQGIGAGDRRRGQDQRLHPRDRAGRFRQRLRRRRAARGDQLQPPASRGSLARGHRALFRRCRATRARRWRCWHEGRRHRLREP